MPEAAPVKYGGGAEWAPVPEGEGAAPEPAGPVG